VQDRHPKDVVSNGDRVRLQLLCSSFTTNDLCTRVLRSADLKIDQCPKITKDFRNTYSAKCSRKIVPSIFRGLSNLISAVFANTENHVTVGHGIRKSLFKELGRVSGSHSGPIDNEPSPSGHQKGTHLRGPNPIICPIKDGDGGRDGVVVVVGSHLLKI
jgi:hypothetical protein